MRKTKSMPETPDRHSARYFASLYSPPSGRAVLEALFGIESEIAASLHSGLDHSVAHIRLQWWREECERVVSRRSVHPLTQTLVIALGAEPRVTAQLAGLSGFVDVAVWDLANATFGTGRELTAYCERWAAAMVIPVAVHGAPDMTDSQHWLALGAALRESEMLANLDSEAHSGRLRLPLDEIEAAGVAPEDLGVTPWPAQVAALVARRHEALRSVLASAVAALERRDQPALRGLLVWAALAARRSIRAQRSLPKSRLPQRSDALADGWLAWRAARRALAENFRLT